MAKVQCSVGFESHVGSDGGQLEVKMLRNAQKVAIAALEQMIQQVLWYVTTGCDLNIATYCIGSNDLQTSFKRTYKSRKNKVMWFGFP